MAKFFGKNPHKKYVRQFPNSIVKHIIQPKVDNKETVEENKEVKKDKEMADERLEKIEKIIGSKAPKRKVKVEKKDKGLIERTENSTILLTEDNKMVLND
jgi:uncharacterized protein (UPF0305 family)